MILSKYRITLIIQFAFVINAFSQLNVHAYLLEARTEMSKKNYFDAIQKLDVCIEVNPNEYEAYFYRGVCKYYLKDNLGAIQDLNSATSIYNPMLTDTYHYRSFVKYRLGDNEGAVKDINHVIDGPVSDAQLYVERAFYKLSNQNYTGVISDCNTALTMKYFSENLYLCKGMAENALDKYDSALINYTMALKLNSQDEDLYVRMGITNFNLEKYKEAVELYNKALKIDSACTLAYYNRAEANIKMNNTEEAIENFNMVLNYDPTNSIAYFNRGILEAGKNDYRNAIADFDKVLSLNPKNIQALLNRAKLKDQIKDYQGALADYNTTISIFPYLVEAYYDRAHLKESLHDDAGAKADYRLGSIMTQINRSRDTTQKANDSIKLAHLLALNSNFNGNNQKISDTTSIDLMPLFSITLKDNADEKLGCIPLLLKNSKKEYLNFCLTNKKILFVEKNAKESLKNTLNEMEKDTAQVESMLEDAVQKTNMQLFNAAGKEYDKIIKRDTGFALAYFASGIDICKGIELLGQPNENEQDNYTYIGKTYRVVNNPVNDKYKKALTNFSKIIQMEPGFAFAYYNRAYVKYKLHDFNGAIDDYNNAIQITPDFADAYYNRGILLFLLNDKIDACEDFSKAGELGLTEAYLVIKLYCSQVTK